MKRIIAALAAVLAAAGLQGGPAHAAADPAADAATGLRARLAARGVETNASLTGLWIGDVAGGMHRGGVYNSLGVASVDADLGALTGGWHGAHAFANVDWIRGGSASASYIGDALVASNLDGFDSIRLYEAWLEQSFPSERGSLRVGVLGADDEFTGTESGALFTNSAFGWEAGIGANVVNGGPIYFAPALGARLAIEPAAGWQAQAAVYDGDSFDSPDGDPGVNPHGLHFALSRAQGAFLIGQLARNWNDGEDAHGLQGALKAGAWRHTADFPDNRRDALGGSFALTGLDPAVHHGNHGVYGSLEQRLWASPGPHARAVTAWLRVAGAPADRSAYERVFDGGFNGEGLVPGRGDDVLGVAIAQANVSREAARAALEAGQPAPRHERVIEACWQVHVNAHLRVTPDLQWVQHPGTIGDVPDAWVAGLRVTLQ